MFHVGQKVVCVNERCTKRQRGYAQANLVTLPVEGNIYTVRGFVRELGTGTECLLLEEIHHRRGWANFAGEPGYSARRFRPVAERPTSIEWAHKLLKGEPVELV